MDSVFNDSFRSIEMIYENKINNLNIDKTIVGTIIKQDEKITNKYWANIDNTYTLVVYSDENKFYGINEKVLILIPEGNYDNKKIILSSYEEEEEIVLAYNKPFENFIDLTENLSLNYFSKIYSCTANNTKNTRIKIGELKNVPKYKKYSVLGLKFKIKSWLDDFSTVEGSYGIQLEIIDSAKNSYNFSFDCAEFFGNPYNFSMYYSQEKLFDLSDITLNIEQIDLYLYQKNNFKDATGNFIPPKNMDINDNEINPNIFITELYTGLGELINNYNTETVILYTDQDTYEANSNTPMLNTRWIHYDSLGDVIGIDQEVELPESAVVHWYRKKLQNGIKDNIAGTYWQEILQAKNKLKYNPTLDCSLPLEAFKVIVEFPSLDYQHNKCQLDDSWINGTRDEKELIWNQYREAVTYYTSDILELNNAVQMSPNTILDLIQSLQINCDSVGYNGQYHIYSSTNELLNPGEGAKIRKFEATYDSITTGIKSLDDDSETIIWKIPIQNSMIVPPEENIDYIIDDEYATSYSTELINGIIYAVISRNRYFKIQEGETEEDNVVINVMPTTQTFKIKSFYSKNAINNKVYCIIHREGRDYTAEYTLTFGNVGNSGTNATFLLKMEKGATAIIADSINPQPVTIKAYLYDYEGKEVKDFKLQNVKWYVHDTTITDSEGRKVSQVQENFNITNNSFTISYAAGVNDSPETGYDNCIIQAETMFNGVTLTAYLPIPIKHKSFNGYIYEGPTQIIYNSMGTLTSYYKDVINLYTQNNGKIENITSFWKGVKFGNSKQFHDSMFPKVENKDNKTSYVLTPPALYTPPTGNSILSYGIVYYKLNNRGEQYEAWHQPILILQNHYGNAMLNNWNGEFTIDEKNGTILGTVFGAGTKDTKNRFTGVLMGKTQDENNTLFGLYGMHNGTYSFGFKEDGTGFIGTPSKGQITFNGSVGKIESRNYNETQKGMSINFSEGTLRAAGPLGQVYLAAPATKTSSMFDISVKVNNSITNRVENKSIMKVGEGTYYLQSANYVQGTSGTRFDLQNGSLISHGFNLTGYQIFQGNTIKNSYLNINTGATYTPFRLVSGGSTTFSLNWDGSVKMTKAKITGELGPWTLDDYGLRWKKNDNKYGFCIEPEHINSTSHVISFWYTPKNKKTPEYKFTLDGRGVLTARDVNLTGEIHAKSGSIGPLRIDPEKGIIINPGNITGLKQFILDIKGDIIAENITATGIISADRIEGVSTKQVTFQDIRITGGELTLGGMTITEDNFKTLNGMTTIQSNGDASFLGKVTIQQGLHIKSPSQGVIIDFDGYGKLESAPYGGMSLKTALRYLDLESLYGIRIKTGTVDFGTASISTSWRRNDGVIMTNYGVTTTAVCGNSILDIVNGIIVGVR